MNNTKQIIDSHNKRILTASMPTDDTAAAATINNKKTCNCRQKNACPLDGNCLQSSVIYQATVTRKDNNTTETYIRFTEHDFKTRYRNHTASFGTFRWPLVHGLPWWTWSMDYLNGLPVDYPKWTTLKFVANINLTMPEPEQKMRSIDKHITEHLRCNRFNHPNKRCDRSEQLRFNPQTFPTLTSGLLLQNIGFERVFLLLPTW